MMNATWTEDEFGNSVYTLSDDLYNDLLIKKNKDTGKITLQVGSGKDTIVIPWHRSWGMETFLARIKKIHDKALLLYNANPKSPITHAQHYASLIHNIMKSGENRAAFLKLTELKENTLKTSLSRIAKQSMAKISFNTLPSKEIVLKSINDAVVKASKKPPRPTTPAVSETQSPISKNSDMVSWKGKNGALVTFETISGASSISLKENLDAPILQINFSGEIEDFWKAVEKLKAIEVGENETLNTAIEFSNILHQVKVDNEGPYAELNEDPDVSMETIAEVAAAICAAEKKAYENSAENKAVSGTAARKLKADVKAVQPAIAEATTTFLSKDGDFVTVAANGYSTVKKKRPDVPPPLPEKKSIFFAEDRDKSSLHFSSEKVVLKRKDKTSLVISIPTGMTAREFFSEMKKLAEATAVPEKPNETNSEIKSCADEIVAIMKFNEVTCFEKKEGCEALMRNNVSLAISQANDVDRRQQVSSVLSPNLKKIHANSPADPTHAASAVQATPPPIPAARKSTGQTATPQFKAAIQRSAAQVSAKDAGERTSWKQEGGKWVKKPGGHH